MDKTESAIVSDFNSLVNDNSIGDEEIPQNSPHNPNEPVGIAGVPGTIFNLTCTVLGTGTLAIPLTFYYSGYLGGIILLTIAWILSAYGMHLLTYASIKTGLYTYKDISEKLGGKAVAIIVQICVFCYTTGSCTAYPIFLGGFLPHICETFAPGTILCDRHFWIMVLSFCIIYPISMFKNLSPLKYFSFVSVTLVFYTALAMCVQTFVTYKDNIEENPPVAFQTGISILRGFPFLTCAFTAHYNSLRFYGELKDRSLKKMNTISVTSTFIAFVVYLFVGLFGYLSLNPHLEGGNVLINYSTDDIPMFVACIGFAFMISISYPLHHHAQRDLFDKLIFSGWKDTLVRRISLSFILISFCMFLATAVEKISLILAYNGSIFGALVVYIFPAFFGFKVGTGFTKWMSLAIMIIGICLSIIGITITTMDQLHVFDE